MPADRLKPFLLSILLSVQTAPTFAIDLVKVNKAERRMYLMDDGIAGYTYSVAWPSHQVAVCLMSNGR